jgi:hypothetical protein
MSTELLYLPSDIPVMQVKMSGFAASATGTALRPTRLPRCERANCGLRGDRVPDLLGGFEAMQRATEIATELGEAEEWRGGHTATSDAMGHVFHISISGGIAVPPPRLAIGMERGTAPDIWEKLRPHAEEDEFHGIDLPSGRIIFRDAQVSGHYQEKLMVSVPSLRPLMGPEGGTESSSGLII